MEPSSIESPTNIHPLNTNWIIWYHNPDDKNWDMNSYKSILELISRISSVIVLEQQDESLFKNILSQIPNASNNDNNIIIDMSNIDISNKDNVKIIKKYLFKILNDKINPITEDTAINESIRRAEREALK